MQIFGVGEEEAKKILDKDVKVKTNISPPQRRKKMKVKPIKLNEEQIGKLPGYAAEFFGEAEVYFYFNHKKEFLLMKCRKKIRGEKSFFTASYNSEEYRRIKKESPDKKIPRPGWVYGGNANQFIYKAELLDKSDFFLLVEGEKCCNYALNNGIPCMSYQGTGGHIDLDFLRGKEILIWPDYDRVGVARANFVKSQIGGHVLEIKKYIKQLTGKDPHDESLKGADICDFRLYDVLKVLSIAFPGKNFLNPKPVHDPEHPTHWYTVDPKSVVEREPF